MQDEKFEVQFAPCFRNLFFPNLSRLRLDEADWKALADQGFVAVERRGRRKHHKLRFRRNGRQTVRYIGSHEKSVAVEAELDVLQCEVRLRRRLARLTRAATNALRSARDRLKPLLPAKGFHFHGRAVRKRREVKRNH